MTEEREPQAEPKDESAEDKEGKPQTPRKTEDIGPQDKQLGEDEMPDANIMVNKD